MTLEQIDLVKRMAAQYPADFEIAYTAADVRRIHKAGKIASLIGIEGGHQINNSLAVLRQMYDLGARYMTLTHVLNTALGRLGDRRAGPPRPDPVRRGGGAGNEPARHAGGFEPRIARDHARGARVSSGAGDFLAFLRTRARRSSARRTRRHPQAGGGERRRGDGEFRNPGYVSDGAQSLGRRPRRGGRALREPAVWRPLYRPARPRQGGARGNGSASIRSPSATLASSRRSHRSHPCKWPASIMSGSARTSTAFPNAARP